MDDSPEDKLDTGKAQKAKAPARKAAPRKRAPASKAAGEAKEKASAPGRKGATSAEPKPARAAEASAKPKSAKPKAVKPKSVQAKPAQPKPANLPPFEGNDGEGVPAETKPAERRPRKQPVARLDAALRAPEPPIAVATHLPELEPGPPVALAPAAEAHEEVPADDVTIHPAKTHAPGVQPHDEGLEFGLSPVDLAPEEKVREEAGFGWFVRILGFTSVLLLLFNSFAIDKWSRERPVTPLNSQVLIAAQQFHASMKAMHLDAPLEGMRSAWRKVKAAQWPGSASAGETAAPEQPPAK